MYLQNLLTVDKNMKTFEVEKDEVAMAYLNEELHNKLDDIISNRLQRPFRVKKNSISGQIRSQASITIQDKWTNKESKDQSTKPFNIGRILLSKDVKSRTPSLET